MTTTTSPQNVTAASVTDTVEAVRGNRALGEVTFSVSGHWDGGLRLDSHTGPLTQAGETDQSRDHKFSMSSDEPEALLGSDAAVSPGEYVLQALAGCYTVTLAANASAQGVQLKGFQLELTADFDLSGFLGVDDKVRPGAQQIRVSLDIDAPEATTEELENLVQLVEARSPIRDTLTRPVEVVTSLTPRE